MDIARIATTRYATKAYDARKRIATPLVEQLHTLLRFSPSSVNSQPWHFVIADNEAGKKRLLRATTGAYSSNGNKILNASHVVVLCSRTELPDEHMKKVLEQEYQDGRFDSAEARDKTLEGRNFYVNLHRNELHDTQHWMEKQVYIALGALLFAAAALDIDATPIEGFDREAMNQELGLTERGLTSVVVAALGYRSADDFNASLPKSRLPEEELFTFL